MSISAVQAVTYAEYCMSTVTR